MTKKRIVTIRPLTLAEYQALVTGIPKTCPNGSFGVAGQTFTAAQAVTYIQTVLNAVAATASAKTAWKDAQMAEAQVIAQDGATVRGIRNNLTTLFSNNTTALADLMITPRKAYKPLSTEARAAANAKAKATRAARGTKGSVQKAAITGDVTGVTITPTTSGANAAPSVTATPVASNATSAPAATAPALAAPAVPAAQAVAAPTAPTAPANTVATAPSTSGAAHS